ncbi:hypothetical protein TrRE_jg7734, partial [Triparma retinervis]
MAYRNLRETAGYGGRVYVLADDRERIVKGLWGGGEGEEVEVLEVNDTDKGRGKGIKSKVVTYLPGECGNVLYLDTDVFFVKDTLRPR